MITVEVHKLVFHIFVSLYHKLRESFFAELYAFLKLNMGLIGCSMMMKPNFKEVGHNEKENEE
jgi:hypothetical protein